MTVTAKIRGHNVEFRDEQWVYVDDGSLVSETWDIRDCGFCNKLYTPEGHDPCLGTLPGVKNACCGHGIEREAYVQFADDRPTVSGKKAITAIKELKSLKISK